MSLILFYSPFNQRSRDTESLMIAFHQQGHRVISLSQQEGFIIHDFLKTKGIETHSYVLPGNRNGWWYYFRHLIYFIRFCRTNKIDVVYSHLEPANFVASIGQYFIRAKTYLCRHHIDEGELYRFDKDLYYRLTYRIARNIIVVSKHARKYMIEKEGIPARKIKHINLAYDFSLYANPDPENIQRIKKQFPAGILLVTACRLTEFKRPDISVQTVNALIKKGFDAKLIILGKGEMHDALLKLAGDLGLKDRVFMPGFVNNVLDYMSAADFFVHPSLLDSSCVAVKEAGLMHKPVIVCKGIGDFEDYLQNGKNGFAINRDRFAEEAATVVAQHYTDKEYLKSMGKNLNEDVMRLFDVKNILPEYSLLNELHG